MTTAPLGFVVPGRLDQVTGGYIFDRRIVEGLRAIGREVAVAELAGEFPAGDVAARAAMAAALRGFPDGAAIVVDGLALAGLAGSEAELRRLRVAGFVHHPLALETGLGAEEGARFEALERRLLPLLRGVLCPSTRSAAAVAAYGVAPARIAITPPGVEKPVVAPGAERAGGPVRLLCVATLTPRKGHLLLVDALAGLADLDWRLLCVGSAARDPATAEALRRRLAETGLAARVELAGEWPPGRLGAAYAAADCFVLPSWYEGYGMAYAEAMAYGLPVVGTTAGAVPEVVPPEAGILVAPGDIAALRAALRRVVAEPALRQSLAAGARQRAAILPDWPDAVAHWARECDRLLAQTRVSR